MILRKKFKKMPYYNLKMFSTEEWIENSTQIKKFKNLPSL